MRVLIADDQRDVGRALAELVRICNHDIAAVVGSGLDAIQAYTRLHPDLVLMDYRMPKLNGATACRNILSKDPAARVILVSGWSPSDDASQSGAIAMLPKPVDLERLNATLQTVAQMLPPPSPAELPFPEICYQPDPLPSPSFQLVPPSLEIPNPEIYYQPESIDYFPPVAEPLPICQMPTASSELPFPSFQLAPPDIFPQTVEASASSEKKISVKRRGNHRRAERARAR